ncbi:MAG: hypothetical protein OXU98_02490 [Gammaproteobacteria bacterium]|nr:hypothetical protein [Gammaproteobacteria bacterium]
MNGIDSKADVARGGGDGDNAGGDHHRAIGGRARMIHPRRVCV